MPGKSIPPSTLLGAYAAQLRGIPNFRQRLGYRNWRRICLEGAVLLDRLDGYAETNRSWATQKQMTYLTLVLLFWEEYDLPTRAAAVHIVYRQYTEKCFLDRILDGAWRHATGQLDLGLEEL